MQERHFSFHLAQTVCSDHHKVRFCFTKNNGLLNWQEGKENSSNAFPANIISCTGGFLLTGKIL